jgi:hypothetical protein
MANLKNFKGREAFAPAVQYKTGSIHRCCRERRRNEIVISVQGIPLRRGFAAMLGCLRAQQWHGLRSAWEDNNVPGRLLWRWRSLSRRDGHWI